MIAKKEVINDEYIKFLTATGKVISRAFSKKGYPASNVRWFEAIEYCNWRSKKEWLEPCYSIQKSTVYPTPENWRAKCYFSKNGYRLPTEAEWCAAAIEGGWNCISQCS